MKGATVVRGGLRRNSKGQLKLSKAHVRIKTIKSIPKKRK